MPRELLEGSDATDGVGEVGRARRLEPLAEGVAETDMYMVLRRRGGAVRRRADGGGRERKIEAGEPECATFIEESNRVWARARFGYPTTASTRSGDGAAWIERLG